MTSLAVPESLDELLSLIEGCQGRRIHLLAGGTDWLIRHRARLDDRSAVFDLSRVQELRGIRVSGDALIIGSMETMGSIAANPDAARNAAALCDAASAMGSVQIRNRATIGGNVANASFAADTPCALASLRAQAVIASPSSSRTIPVENVPSRVPNENSLNEDEVITSFVIPIKEGYVSAFGKIGSRSEVSIARLNMAVSAKYDNGCFTDARVYAGTLGSAALRCEAAERALAARGGGFESFRTALAEFVEAAIPGRHSLQYKKSAIQGLALDVAAKLLSRARGDNA
jgi:carbon-monoxide dehydrogenase medium subunit